MGCSKRPVRTHWRASPGAPCKARDTFTLALLAEVLPGIPAQGRYLDQALNVRPVDGDVLFEAGRIAMAAGDVARGIEYWQRAAQQSDDHQEYILAALAPHLPADTLVEQIHA